MIVFFFNCQAYFGQTPPPSSDVIGRSLGLSGNRAGSLRKLLGVVQQREAECAWKMQQESDLRLFQFLHVNIQTFLPSFERCKTNGNAHIGQLLVPLINNFPLQKFGSTYF